MLLLCLCLVPAMAAVAPSSTGPDILVSIKIKSTTSSLRKTSSDHGNFLDMRHLPEMLASATRRTNMLVVQTSAERSVEQLTNLLNEVEVETLQEVGIQVLRPMRFRVDLKTIKDILDRSTVVIPGLEYLCEFNTRFEFEPPTEFRNVTSIKMSEPKLNDPRIREQYYLDVLEMEEVWKTTQGKLKEIPVAVLDSGIYVSHPEFEGQLFRDKDGNFGKNTVSNNTNITDSNDHGTPVSGIIAAKANNSIGIAGMSPNAKILTVRVFDESGSSIASIIRGVNYAIANDVPIISMSLGGHGYASEAFREGLKAASDRGVIMTCSAGNLAANNTEEPFYPCDFQIPNLFCVGSLRANSTTEYYQGSNYGHMVRLVAPGEGIISLSSNNGYATTTGTSLATPMVSAIFAILLGLGLDASQAINSVMKTVGKLDGSDQAKVASDGGAIRPVDAIKRALEPSRVPHAHFK